jgi:hypothetical protein
MRRRDSGFLLPLLFISLAFAKDKDKTLLPKLVVSARYVMVTTYFGDPVNQPLNLHITAEDRQAVTDVQNAIEKWGRYELAYRPGDADLIIVVRKGRLLDATVGARIHAGSRDPMGPNGNTDPNAPDRSGPNGGIGPNENGPSVRPEVAADVGDPQDMIAVYATALGRDTSPLWRGRKGDGLKAPDMHLVAEFRTKVEAAAKAP